MEKTFSYIIGAAFLTFILWLKIKEFKNRKERRETIKNMTPEFFRKKEAKTPRKDYIKWLRRFYTEIAAEALKRKEKGFTIRPELMNTLILTEKEIENLNARMGNPINLGKKISEEFQDSQK